jgi:4-carboxymuconolactone decarboxylase
MKEDTSPLGGRLPLVMPSTFSAGQRDTYDFIDKEFLPPDSAKLFLSKTENGALIGPFNSALYSPDISLAFLAWQIAEERHTSLDVRVRQIVILAVGTVWQADYELYAHTAVAQKVGLSDQEIADVSEGRPPSQSIEKERIAQKYAMQLTSTRRIDDGLFAEAFEAFGPKGLVDMVHLIGAYQTVCGILNSFVVPAPNTERHSSRT